MTYDFGSTVPTAARFPSEGKPKEVKFSDIGDKDGRSGCNWNLEKEDKWIRSLRGNLEIWSTFLTHTTSKV